MPDVTTLLLPTSMHARSARQSATNKKRARPSPVRRARGKTGAPSVATAPTPDLLHTSVYSELAKRFVMGRVRPGSTLSTRGLAAELGVSQMPVREALGRLAAEGAVEIRSKRKIAVPPMTSERFNDLLRCRMLLESEAARAAFPFLNQTRLKQLKATDKGIGVAMRTGDVAAYMEGNYNFHFLIYRAQPRRTLLQLIETLWLQFGPYMRVVYGRFGTANLVDQHRVAIACIEAGDAEGLEKAIATDISDGMGLIGVSGFDNE
jgi:DNA-binding GntR family transcriptional regulator